VKKSVIIPAVILGGLAVIGGSYEAASLGSHGQVQKVVFTAPATHKAKAAHHEPAKPAPAKTIYVTPPPAAPTPQAAPPQAPIQSGAYGPYLDDLARAGIVAPDQRAVQTANNVKAAWASGETEAQTNQEYLIPGGIYQYHLGAFNAIVHANFG
jgi:hypothetical protein